MTALYRKPKTVTIKQLYQNVITKHEIFAGLYKRFNSR